MLKIEHYKNLEKLEQTIAKAALIDFLYTNLDRFRDSKSAIEKAIDYAFSKDAGRGGFILVAYNNDRIVGAVVMVHTGMVEFIPEYYLVYIAVDANMRGQGVGARLMQEAFDQADGDIALHVEYDNPAQHLYERMGFATKYAEMRWKRS
ncbi:MAG: GNAT family N-acetyltransferase [Candidatus Cloacimonadaceae bacterium]|jgi:ribosomal protein S18 acetylase RimI-like enzyme|nr:GNAT family N-acetyltransferase [Candidatus Cloacimonadota bacterium]MDY0127547.1 GNAT family N-acetyltransferase [Candidatus Cloacimonadaceae bacterium]MCB5255267.1 GNAT family N-acetyltransferase [Candidatus Cloacimonadota bacterium]MCK9178837.1 GNAT family N-acetyltransferase [Candidatus Cloacimonadota bacterium]MCK9242960.1 GNAT family N-acetyltransferase [Candidatus Cloacimonadota bacterium]